MRALLVLLAVVAVVAGYLFLQAPALAVHSVEVAGIVRLDAKRVVSEAAVRDGTPLWRIRSGEVAARVQEDPRVLEATVEKRWPNRLIIHVKERRTVASIVLPGGSFAEVDAGGTVVQLDERLLPDWPVITGVGMALAPNAVVEGTGPARAIAVAEALSRQPTVSVSEVHVTDEDTIVVYLDDGTPVDFGDARDPDRQSAILAGLLNELAGGTEPAAYISVVDPDAPVVRPLHSGEAPSESS